ncbi:MAG: hypothetical protein NW241_21745 [Bacteroidia bacterium]|nr:hypothetical protein [Bacteroidia bacterium]
MRTAVLLFSALLAACSSRPAAPAAGPLPAADTVQVIRLVQVPGRFTDTALSLKPGRYIFEMTNQGIGHEVGFYLRSAADEAGLPGTEAMGHITDGQTARTGIVELGAGEYRYSCPLNPTPDFTLRVE